MEKLWTATRRFLGPDVVLWEGEIRTVSTSRARGVTMLCSRWIWPLAWLCYLSRHL
jgi:hypothetical protein